MRQLLFMLLAAPCLASNITLSGEFAGKPPLSLSWRVDGLVVATSTCGKSVPYVVRDNRAWRTCSVSVPCCDLPQGVGMELEVVNINEFGLAGATGDVVIDRGLECNLFLQSIQTASVQGLNTWRSCGTLTVTNFEVSQGSEVLLVGEDRVVLGDGVVVRGDLTVATGCTCCTTSPTVSVAPGDSPSGAGISTGLQRPPIP